MNEIKRLSEKKYQSILTGGSIDDLARVTEYCGVQLSNIFWSYSDKNRSEGSDAVYYNPRYLKAERRFRETMERIDALNDYSKDIDRVWYREFGYVTVADCLA